MVVDQDNLSLGIAEAARLVGVSTGTIRSWERLGLVQPARTKTGHRRFSLGEVELLRRVRHLREVEQLSLQAIQRTIGGAANTGDTMHQATGASPDWRTKLKRLRQGSGFSLREAKTVTGLSPSFISAIERGRANPSVAALQKLTSAYGTSIVDLMGGVEQTPRTLVRPSDRKVYDVTAGVLMEQLNFGPHQMELHLFTVESGAGTGEAFQHEGEEFIFVLTGQLTVWLDQIERYDLREGDVLYFSSSRLHEWINPGSAQAVFLGVNTPPTF
ncbi:MAG: hypothetical protein QOF73_437 [Thermomicrobiales bacterium]|nr:hypothetical protein [Thermomicrobiales bacterium]